jgi:predicted kinase
VGARPTLFLMVGLPGAGKTTQAKAIEKRHRALRLTPDDWIVALYGDGLDRWKRDAVREPVERLQWTVAERALELGTSVVLDWGFWSMAERVAVRRRAETLGASSKVVFMDDAHEVLWARVAGREESQAAGTLGITRAEFDEWAARFERPSNAELAQGG